MLFSIYAEWDNLGPLYVMHSTWSCNSCGYLMTGHARSQSKISVVMASEWT